ncbi:hypothetical protein Q7C36_001842 [Tachysurus vachellii]|uniref:Uncharacterized protein n=1 Tax=Tachysurus vachellii TaxID=175792 RepID=A0AA88NV70_TACVA|nr:hypothetical protein Q7C36_001842 [Tachysurus vachellii]
MRARRPPSRIPSCENAASTQLGDTHLTPEERAHHVRQQLYLYCGKPGHLLPACPTRSRSRQDTLMSLNVFTPRSQNCAQFDVRLKVQGEELSLVALIDSIVRLMRGKKQQLVLHLKCNQGHLEQSVFLHKQRRERERGSERERGRE